MSRSVSAEWNKKINMKSIEIKSEKIGKGHLWILVTKNVINFEFRCVD